MNMMKHVVVFLVALSLSVCAFAQESQAQPVVSVGPGLVIPLGEIADGTSMGWSVKGYAGYELPIPVVSAAAIVTGGYSMIPTDPPDIGNADLNIYQVMAGARLGMGGFIQPSVTLAVGYGWVKGEGSDFVLDHDGVSFLAGAALEFTGVPLFDIGLHTDYNQIHYADGGGVDYQWFDVGLTLAKRF